MLVAGALKHQTRSQEHLGPVQRAKIALHRSDALGGAYQRPSNCGEVAPIEFHAASMQVIDEGNTTASLVWITDVKPESMGDALGPMIEGNLDALGRRFGGLHCMQAN